MGIIFLFIDGIGLGSPGDENPFSRENLPGFSRLTGGQQLTAGFVRIAEPAHLFHAADAKLGIDGLPQSGTGQATLFSGINAAVILGKHFGPYPHSGIRFLLEKQSLFHQMNEKGKTSHFMNAYPDIFFERAGSRNRWSCTTLMARSAGNTLNRLQDVVNGEAVTAEIMQDVWRSQLGLDVPEITPADAAMRLVRKADEYDLVLYEYYLTDKAGHSMDSGMAKWALERLDSFVVGILDALDSSEHTLLLTSDHGNLEDIRIKTHTMNDVPVIAIGKHAGAFASVQSLTDITPALLSI
jgi:2,3-bisphosphoglycerate-independent phosphoglycerate mutase